jgi:hypothetical protein
VACHTDDQTGFPEDHIARGVDVIKIATTHRSSERRAKLRHTRVLRAVFLAGAVTDAVALRWASYAGRQASRAPQVLP